MAKSISPQDLRKALSGTNAPTVIDVRRKVDYQPADKIDGAIRMDPEEIEDWVKDLPAGTPTVVYCVRGGSVSQGVADHLKRKGIQAVFLEGGLKAWDESEPKTP
jgi:rhodanese-related sulfurtransferase